MGSWPRAREASRKRAGAGARRQGQPAHRAAPPQELQIDCLARAGARRPRECPGHLLAATRADGLVGPVDGRCAGRGALAQHGPQAFGARRQRAELSTRAIFCHEPPTRSVKEARVSPAYFASQLRGKQRACIVEQQDSVSLGADGSGCGCKF